MSCVRSTLRGKRLSVSRPMAGEGIVVCSWALAVESCAGFFCDERQEVCRHAVPTNAQRTREWKMCFMMKNGFRSLSFSEIALEDKAEALLAVHGPHQRAVGAAFCGADARGDGVAHKVEIHKRTGQPRT